MPRKTPVGDPNYERNAGASMRPRPDAAENEPPRSHHPRGDAASMRPRPDAAENRDARKEGVMGYWPLQ